MFWSHARSHVRKERIVELTMQGSMLWYVWPAWIVTTHALCDDSLQVHYYALHTRSFTHICTRTHFFYACGSHCMTHRPVFGIGMILPGGTGTAEPDDGFTVREWPVWKGKGPAGLWHALCDSSTPDTVPGDAPILPSTEQRFRAEYAARGVLCSVADGSNLETILSATKRTVSRQALNYTMRLPWALAWHQSGALSRLSAPIA
jgi:hypothetical protein